MAEFFICNGGDDASPYSGIILFFPLQVSFPHYWFACICFAGLAAGLGSNDYEAGTDQADCAFILDGLLFPVANQLFMGLLAPF